MIALQQRLRYRTRARTTQSEAVLLDRGAAAGFRRRVAIGT
jgi:hypothetical protein